MEAMRIDPYSPVPLPPQYGVPETEESRENEPVRENEQSRRNETRRAENRQEPVEEESIEDEQTGRHIDQYA